MASALKYRNIVSWAERQIQSGAYKPGDKFLSELALSDKFGFSRQTVRRALEVLEENGYISRVQGSGTYIGQAWPGDGVCAPKRPRSMTIGIVSTYLDDYIYSAIIRGAEDVLAQHGYSVQLSLTKNLIEGEVRALQNVLDSSLDGLIVEPTKSGLPCVNLDLYRQIQSKNIPLVLIDSFHPEIAAPYTALDDEEAGYLATWHLYQMGHRKIAGIFSFSNRQGHLRYLGYARALRELGLSVQDNQVFWHSKETLSMLLESRAFLAELSQCTAVFCYNDKLALQIMEVLRGHGIGVPGDISLVGVDNCELASALSLTSIAHPMDELGSTAARLLLSVIEGQSPENIIFPPRLIQRDSVKRIEVCTGMR